MTDHELIELAAKAVGYKLHRSQSAMDGVLLDDQTYWSPLTDDGDALRLYTRLPFHEIYVSEIGATVSFRRGDGSGRGYKCDEYADEHAGDINAATRRAIVRAAAEIGKAMP
jgi:hypothetical protein